MIHILLILGIAGLVTSTVFTVLAAWGAVRFAWHRGRPSASGFHPPVSLLKPLHGSEPDLEAHLESFFDQDYPRYEVLFCARSDGDPALEAAKRVAARHPRVPVKFLSSGDSPYANAKVWSLERMKNEAEHDIFVISDSDVSVTRNYLRAVMAPFVHERVGLVTCLYRGVSRGTASGGGIWSRLEAIGMSVEMSSGALVARMFEGMKFALGPTMAVRRDCVERVGGFRALASYHADDFKLGNLVAANGYDVVLSTHVIEHHILNSDLASSMRHQIRWMKSTRFSRPKGHLGTALTFSMPYALLAAGAALASHRPEPAALLLAWGWTTRLGLAALMGGLVVGERNGDPGLTRTMLLYPLRDFLGFVYWAASYLSKSIEWRGETYHFLDDGAMLSASAGALESEKSCQLPVLSSQLED